MVYPGILRRAAILRRCSVRVLLCVSVPDPNRRSALEPVPLDALVCGTRLLGLLFSAAAVFRGELAVGGSGRGHFHVQRILCTPHDNRTPRIPRLHADSLDDLPSCRAHACGWVPVAEYNCRGMLGGRGGCLLGSLAAWNPAPSSGTRCGVDAPDVLDMGIAASYRSNCLSFAVWRARSGSAFSVQAGGGHFLPGQLPALRLLVAGIPEHRCGDEDRHNGFVHITPRYREIQQCAAQKRPVVRRASGSRIRCDHGSIVDPCCRCVYRYRATRDRESRV